MNAVYRVANLSKQGHWQSLEREREWEAKTESYLGFIAEIREMQPGMGLRAIYEQYQPEGIGRDAFIALGGAYGLILEPMRLSTRTTFSIKNRRYRNLLDGKLFSNVNHVWVSDITYFRIWERFYYLSFVMDAYSRRILGFNVADSLHAEHALSALNMALSLRGQEDYQQTLIHHSDRGSQYISNDYTATLDEYGICCSMCDNVLDNAHAERVNGTIKNQYLEYWRAKIHSFAHLRSFLERAVNTYNNDRHHQALGMAPTAFENALKTMTNEQRPQFSVFVHHDNHDEPTTQLPIDWGR
jgi:putative transposase